jgi:Amt family ammonium transporter
MGAIAQGLLVSPLCFSFVTYVKGKLGYDDSLDVFGVHCVGGIFGALSTGVLVSPALGGTGVYDYVANKVADFDMTAQVISQAWAVGTTLLWSGVVAFIAYKIVDMTIGLRVSEDVEREGLDTTEHGERAYHY